MSDTIGSLIFPNPRVKSFDKEVARAIAKNGFKANNLLVDNNTFIGVEVEVERILREDGLMPLNLDGDVCLWKNVVDNSLRNNGREFVSIPMKGETVEFAIHTLKEHLTKDKTCIAHEYTDRTSIHVHMNAMDLTPEQYINMVLAYILVEPILYEYVGGDRAKNIFCVPITESDMTGTLSYIIEAYEKNKIASMIQNLGGWQKYTGLNLLPTTHYGTIEFRHLIGTDDYTLIYGWINLILSLKKFATNITYEKLKATILEINTTSEYANLMHQIFGDLIAKLPVHDLQMTLENTSIFIKDVYSYSDNRTKVLSIFKKKPFAQLAQTPLVTQAKKIGLLVVYDIEEEIRKLERAKAIYVKDKIPYESAIKEWVEKLKDDKLTALDKKVMTNHLKSLKNTLQQYNDMIADYDRSIEKLRNKDKEEQDVAVPHALFGNPVRANVPNEIDWGNHFNNNDAAVIPQVLWEDNVALRRGARQPRNFRVDRLGENVQVAPHPQPVEDDERDF